MSSKTKNSKIRIHVVAEIRKLIDKISQHFHL